ncbi:MAG: gamma-glutamylcyclotransferase family protein [Candidatus Hodarchaeales archaeon]
MFIYDSFMHGQVNHKYLKAYSYVKAILYGYRRCWPRSKDTAIFVKAPLGSVLGELYSKVRKQDLLRINRLHGIPHNYTHQSVTVTTLKEKIKVEAIVYYPSRDLMREWLQAETKERLNKTIAVYQ